jgi:hypothetical protein
MRTFMSVIVVAALAGCASRPPPIEPTAVVASPYEPAAQLEAVKGSYAEGAVLGAAGGAGIGAMSAKASAGLLCTIGGPLCLIVVVPAAIVGGLVGGVAGAAADAITTDPLGRVQDARGTIDRAVAEMRLTEALAQKTSELAKLPYGKDAAPSPTLEIGVSDLEIVAREKDMALVLHGRARLLQNEEAIYERTAEAQTGFRKYQDWAANEAEPLKQAVDQALAELGRALLDVSR